MKIQALDIQIGHRIIAYCNSRMQTCTVREILYPDQKNVTLKVFTSGHYRHSASSVVQFNRDAFIDVVG